MWVLFLCSRQGKNVKKINKKKQTEAQMLYTVMVYSSFKEMDGHFF